MKMLKSIFLALSIGMMSAPSMANENTHKNHLMLAEAVKSTGVKIYINVREVCDGTYGAYFPSLKSIVICQTNGKPGGEEVEWSSEDYDTLRHEVHHYVQDCMKGSNNDGEMGLVYRDTKQFITNTLTKNYIESIINNYSSKGADNETIVLELESFSVAALNDPIEQTRDVINYCM